MSLPWGTYYGFAEKTGGTRASASTRTEQAVHATGYGASWIVVESDANPMVHNLEPVEPKKDVDDEFMSVLEGE